MADLSERDRSDLRRAYLHVRAARRSLAEAEALIPATLHVELVEPLGDEGGNLATLCSTISEILRGGPRG